MVTAEPVAAEAAALPEPSAVIASSPGAVIPVTPRPVFTDEELNARLLGTGSEVGVTAAPPVATQRRSWWMWPMGLLGMLGMAGLVFQKRPWEAGDTDDVLVLSRTAVTRTSSLAVIEVTDVNGDTRRMLVGLGGGAPSLVADLSAPAPAVAAAATVASLPAVAAGASASASASAPEPKTAEELEAAWMREGGSAGLDPESAPRPRRRGAAAYVEEAQEDRTTSRRKGKSALISEVLAERQERVEPPKPARKRRSRDEDVYRDPWARDFAAILGQPGRSK